MEQDNQNSLSLLGDKVREMKEVRPASQRSRHWLFIAMPCRLVLAVHPRAARSCPSISATTCGRTTSS